MLKRACLLLVSAVLAATWVAAQEPFPNPFNPPPAPLSTLTVLKTGSGVGTVTGTGINCGSDCTHAFVRGNQVTLIATSSGGGVFAGWSGSCTGTGSCVVTMLGAQAVTATFNTVVSGGNELRCAELGVNCICSEPLNTSTYVAGNAPFYWNPSDTTVSDKQCTNEGVATGSVLVDQNLANQTPVNSGEAWNALPAGHTLSWILKQNDTASGNSLSHKFSGSDPSARRGMRFYRFISSDHAFTDEVTPLCNSGKVIQIGPTGTFTGGPLIQLLNDTITFYDVNTTFHWTQNMGANCCLDTPGATSTPPSRAQLRGKWWRIEFYMNNTAPGGVSTYWEMWMKNVTDNGPDLYVMDSRQPMTSTGPDATFWWQSPMTDNLHVAPGFNMTDFAVNMFRSNNGDVCTGHIAHTSTLWAAWSTNTGQRIGAAIEVEGGAVSTIAANYPGDVGIENDSRVIFYDRFAGSVGTIASRYENTNTANITVSTDRPTGSPVGTQSLQVGGSGGHLYKNLANIVPAGYTEAYLRYYVKYTGAQDYGAIHSGVWLLGQNPSSDFLPSTCCTLPTGTDRFYIGPEIGTGTGVDNAFDLYSGWMEMQFSGINDPSICGGNGDCYFGNTFVPDATQLTRDNWHLVEVYIKLNNPTTGRTGELRLWIDNTEIINLGPGFPNGSWSANVFTPNPAAPGTFDGFRFRSTAALALNGLWLLNGGTANPNGVRYAHLAIATQRVGPLVP